MIFICTKHACLLHAKFKAIVLYSMEKQLIARIGLIECYVLAMHFDSNIGQVILLPLISNQCYLVSDVCVLEMYD